MQDYLYLLIAVLLMGISCMLQYIIAKYCHSFLFVLPLLFGIATFWLGFLSLLFAFALIFIGELAVQSYMSIQKQKE